MAIDVLELQLASAMQRFATLQRRASSIAITPSCSAGPCRRLGTTLEELRVAQEQLIRAGSASRRCRPSSRERER